MDEVEVWVQTSDGTKWPIHGTCAIGRSKTNDIIVNDSKVSRRHVLIHKQDEAEYWIIDLGSGNGTYLNGRRVTLSTKLKDGDELKLGDMSFAFRQTVMSSRPDSFTAASRPTLIELKKARVWLLVADVKGSTALAHRLSTTELAMTLGKWTGTCKEAVEESGGQINKYLGDGFLAYWPFDKDNVGGILQALDRLRVIRRDSESPPFRVALHHGVVAIGGAGSLGEDSLTGNDVALVFRMEKLAGKLGHDLLVSEAVATVLGDRLPVIDVGIHELQGFEREQLRFFAA
jgi:adenylate cyclase